MILLLRHAEKLRLPAQGLTEKGLRDAFACGEKLKNKGLFFDMVISSPVERCVQTAECIVKGLDADIPIKETTLLGNPGIFIADDKKAAKIFEQYSVVEVINKMIRKEVLPGFIGIDVACKSLADDIQDYINSGQSVLYVSHDAVIMPFVANQLAITTPICENEIIGYLEGFIKVYGTTESFLESCVTPESFGLFNQWTAVFNLRNQ